MKSPRTILFSWLVSCVLAAVTPGWAAEADLGKAADNKILAQRLVNQAMAANPDLVGFGLHAIKAGSTELRVVAQTMDIIGRLDDAGDLEIVKADMVKIYAAALPAAQGPGKRMKVMLPLRNGTGGIIGLAVLSFKPGPQIDPLSAHERAEQIMKTVSRQLPDLAALYRPVDSL
jgi:hypothetical protein